MEILRHLKAKGYELHILSKADSNDVERLRDEGFHCIDVGSVVLNPWKAFLFFARLVREIKRINPVIILSFTIRPNIFGSMVARLLNIPIVSNVTGTGPLTTDNRLVYRIIRGVYRFAFQKNQTVFFQNEDDYRYFLEKGYVTQTQAKLLPGSGVDTNYYAPRVKSSPSFTFLMVSRLIVDKGIRDYVEAARLVKKTILEIQFQLLGPYWQQSTAQNTITEMEVKDWEAQGIVTYLGYTLDVRSYMAEADVIVLPSYREGCANVLMQGASMAKPLIATNVTGCRNLIDDGATGYLCEVRNPLSLAEQMLKMHQLSLEERLKMGQQGREKMIREYQKKIVLEAYEREVYSQHL